MKPSGGKELLLWLLRLRRRYRVSGDSMNPLLSAGDEVLVDPRAYRHQVPHVGDLLVARHPDQKDLRIIKRVKEVTPDGEFLLTGDNPDPARNSPARVPGRLILGRVTSCFAAAQ